MTKLMLDLETLGNGPDAVICQIGACYFDDEGYIGKCFHQNVDFQDVQKFGFKFDGNTIEWWLQQTKEAQLSIIDQNQKVDIITALDRFSNFAREAEEIWSHATFDFVIIQNAFRKISMPSKISYRAGADIRTLDKICKKLGYKGKDFVREGTHHNALADCKFQVQYVSDMLKFLRSKFELSSPFTGDNH